MSLPLHRSDERSPGDRGRAFGLRQRDGVRNTIDVYRGMFAAILGWDVATVAAAGREVAARVELLAPRFAEEIAGIAAGAAISVDELFACNARSELLARGRYVLGGIANECSTIAVDSTGAVERDPFLAENWDFHPALRPSRVVWHIQDPAFGALATFTEAGLLAKIGINDRGVGCALNLLATDRDGDAGDGLPLHLLIRRVLEQSATTSHAASIVSSACVSASACLTLVGPGDQELIGIELHPAGRALGRAEDGALLHTNHFLWSDDVNDLILQAPSGAGTVSRLRQLQAARPVSGRWSPACALDLLASGQPGQNGALLRSRDERPWPARVETLATVTLRPDARQLSACGWPEGPDDMTVIDV